MGRELTDEALRDEMLAMFGTKRTVSLMGWAVLFGIAGVHVRSEMRQAPIGGMTARYRAVTDLIRLGDHLRAAGYDLETVPEDAPAITEMLRAVRYA